MIKYLKAYYSIKQKDVEPIALESWRIYIQGKPRIYNMDVCRAYQRGFIHAYRKRAAIEKLALNKSE